MSRWFSCLVVAVVAVACSHTVGAKVDSDQFEKGKATMADVVKQLGPPTSQATTADAAGHVTSMLTYVWGTSGLGGYEGESTTFVFNKDKILDSTSVAKVNNAQPQQPSKN